ncbi:MAG: hypothetical protein GY869_00885 [Planctomycetes bacterium]|nr:hypothetical protein [Planctomycetota bacterium]
MKFTLLVAKSNPIKMAFALILLIILYTIFSYLIQVAIFLELPEWTVVLFDGAAKLAFILGAILLVWAGWSLLVRIGRWAAPIFQTQTVEFDFSHQKDSQVGSTRREDQKSEIIKDTQLTVQTVDDLNAVLSQIKADRHQAKIHLNTASIYIQTLVRLIKGIAIKTEKMSRQVKALSEAQSALQSQDNLKVAAVVGKITDPHLRELMLCDVQNKQYWIDVTRTVSTQTGVIDRWCSEYQLFAGQLIIDLTITKVLLEDLKRKRYLSKFSGVILGMENELIAAKTSIDSVPLPYDGEIAELSPPSPRQWLLES